MAMNAVTLFGAPYSVYVRICRITLAEKGVRHTLEPVDVFSDDGVPPAHLQRPKRARKTCDVSESTMARWIRGGVIRTTKIGGVRYVDVSAWVNPEKEAR